MSKNTNTLSRRSFLKGAAYTSALSMGGLSSLAVASSANAMLDIESGMITLLNQSAKTVALDAKQPITLEKKNGYVVVNVNKASKAGSARPLNLDAGQQLSFAVEDGLTPTLTNSNQYHDGINSTIFVGKDNFPASLYDATFV